MDMDVKTVMDTWTLQMGFPVVTVTRFVVTCLSQINFLLVVLRDYAANTADVRQSRFLISTSASESSSTSPAYRWWVPITFAPAGGNFNDTFPKAWLREDQERSQVPGLPDSETAVVFNVQETGYYRVNYDKKNWQLIAQQLNRDHLSIHVVNR